MVIIKGSKGNVGANSVSGSFGAEVCAWGYLVCFESALEESRCDQGIVVFTRDC